MKPQIAKLDVLLLSMPFGPLDKPSYALGLLKAGLHLRGVSVQVHYPSIEFAQLIGTRTYVWISQGQPEYTDLLGEWIFSVGLFPLEDLDVGGYVRDIFHKGVSHHGRQGVIPWLDRPDQDRFLDEIFHIRDQVNGFLDRCVEDVLRDQPRIVGFTSMFQQHVASLALAKRIKSISPQTFVIFGGPNCEGQMGIEIVRQFPFLDAVVSGEGDLVFSDIVERVLRYDTISGIPGVLTQNSDLGSDDARRAAPMVRQMDSLPYPDYEEYFEELEASGVESELPYPKRVMFETSRGCWWGEKQHCTFCGLNGLTMTFRSKSAERAMEELLYLREKYATSRISVTDNILDMHYFKDLLPMLAERQLGLELYYEVKSNLRKDQLRMMHDAGITWIQPGIESFSSDILRLMKKGVKGIQNIQVLKWCLELGISPNWNLLFGFPGESPEEYRRMADMVRLLTHLPPPVWAGEIRLDRFSPNFSQADSLGFKNVRPYPAYNYIYPLGKKAVANLAYAFTYDYQEERDVAGYTKSLIDQIDFWKDVHHRSDLYFTDKGEYAQICDLRPGAYEPLSIVSGLAKDILIECDRAQSPQELQQRLSKTSAARITESEIRNHLESFVEQGFIFREDELYLTLALPNT